MPSPADEALLKSFSRIATQRRNKRAEELLAEVDRISELEGVALILSEPIDFYPQDPDFARAARAAALLLEGVSEKSIDYVSFRPDHGNTHKRVVYVAYKRGHVRSVSGSEGSVQLGAWVEAWERAGV